ncbi:hypothetical protein V5G99_08930 [Bibersteinia trehalosi]|uniref:hypothetical protein n=1 Tax=Bibersteinia trehalosi TaxID=47735 RepID=UPI003D28A011
MENRFFIFIQENPEKETRFGIKEDPEYFKKIATVTGGSLIGKLLDTGYGKIENSPLMNKYGESIIRPTLNSISGEISTKIISEKIEDIDSRRRGDEMD